MNLLRKIEVGPSLPSLAAFRDGFGYVPALYLSQGLLPGLIQAEAGLAESILFQDSSLSRVQKERLLLALAASAGNTYCATAHYQMLCLLGEPEERLDQILNDYRRTDLAAVDGALLDFAVTLGVNGAAIS